MTRSILVGGGGTAGHVFPAIAVANELREMAPDLEPVFVGVADRLEARLVPEAGFRLHTIDAVAIPRRPSPRLLRVPGALRAGVRRCAELIREERAVAAVTFGGYVSFPLDRAAWREDVPLVVHEQNSIPGLTNRVAARWADRIAVTFPGSADRFRHPERAVVTGNPVRADVLGLDRERRRPEARRRFDLDPDLPTVLVFGGSQGARTLNQAVIEAHDRWDGLRLQVLHATGTGGYAAAASGWERARAAAEGPPARLVDFIDDMADAYAAADVVVCRAGATSIAELTALGLPAVLVPYPHATADHQTHNAHAVERAGGACVIDDDDLDGATLVSAVRSLLGDDAAFARMSRASRAFGQARRGHRRGAHRARPRPTGGDSMSGSVLDAVPTLDAGTRVHLVGVGGAGMSGIARILLLRGVPVSGSDLRESRSLEELRVLGADLHVGHAAVHVHGAGVVVTSSAVPRDNVEVAAARTLGLPVVPRAGMLAALMERERAVLVAGTHGKTTTTSMTVVALQAAGGDPSFAIGGSLNESGTNAHAGGDGVFVAEADESDRSFLAYRPDVAVITNVEHDHPEEFADERAVDEAFAEFVARRTADAPAIVCVDDAGGARLAERVAVDVVRYGADPRADVRLLRDGAQALVRFAGEGRCRSASPCPGTTTC